MRRIAKYLFPSIFAALGACESVDDYVGRTLDGLRSEPTSRLAAKTQRKLNEHSSKHRLRKPYNPAGRGRVTPPSESNRVKSLSFGQRMHGSRHCMSSTAAGRTARYTSVDRRHIEEDAP